jgi:DNA-directed RNA polymerase
MLNVYSVTDLERDLEDASATVGAERYIEEQALVAKREGFERTDNVQKVIRGALPILSGAIKSWLVTTAAKKGRKPVAYAHVSQLDPDRVALVALSHAFGSVLKQGMISATALGIGRGIQVELEADMIEEADLKAFKGFQKASEGVSSSAANMRRHQQLVAKLQVGLGWPDQTQALVGGQILNLTLTSLSEVFQRDTLKDRRGIIPILSLTEEAITLLATLQESQAWMNPVYQPMVTKPRAWNHFFSGAYHDVRLSRGVRMVRTFNKEHCKTVQEAIEAGTMEDILIGLNAIQDTRFAIDRRVLDVILQCREEGLRPSVSFPLGSLPDAPKKLTDAEWEAMPQNERSAVLRRRRTIKDIRGAAAAEGGVFASDMAMADLLADEEAFYLPHNLDFRGRGYAVPHFNPQRADHIKGLFHFADTVPLGVDGGKWLMIHLANCGDFEKVSKKDFDARVQWVRDNEGEILLAASDPMGSYDFWGAADSPFCFLQACFEYLAWMKAGFSEGFLSTVSGAQDGSCSGLQHYSAMTRSEAEGYHVNLLPRATPGDIYQVVSDQALPGIKAEAAEGCVMAQRVLDQGFGRSDVKRNVMTYFYGSGKFGMRGQHMEDTMRPLADKVALGEIAEHPFSMEISKTNEETGEVLTRQDGGFGCAVFLANHIYNAVVSVAPKADEAATWFQHVASTLAHESLPVTWVAPTGLPVVQKYQLFTHKRVNMWLYDRKVVVPAGDSKLDEAGNILSRIECLIREAPTKRIDKNKARNGISPNVVHSMDAAHLIKTVVKAHKEGITHFQLIHDSFATHFGHTERFVEIIREAFVEMYENYCPFEAIETAARAALSEDGQEKLKPAPVKGSLDLQQVLQSAYVFA